MIDNRGTRLEEGQRVAYNISGQIAEGILLKGTKKDLTSPSGWKYVRHDIRVELLHDAAGKKRGHVSKITNPLNILVLETVPLGARVRSA